MRASVAAPKSAGTSKVSRQPDHSDTRLPTGAATQASTPSPLSPLDMMRAPSAGMNRSRTRARAHITTAPMATPCSTRQPISHCMLGASVLPTDASV